MSKDALQRHLPTLGLLLVAVIWGAGFIWTQAALDSGFSPTSIMVLRFGVASLILLAAGAKRIFPIAVRDLGYGSAAGTLLFLGFWVQTTGLRYTTPSNNGFFTATNVIMVPFLAWIFHKKRPPLKLVFCCVTALAGFFILSYRPGAGFRVNAGDLLTLLSACFFACHITALGVISEKLDALRLTFLQMAAACVLSLLGFLLFERDTFGSADFAAGGLAVLCLGLFSTCLCFFLQTWAQSGTSSGKAAIILSGESLWCMIFSVIAGYESFSVQMVAGGLLIAGATVLLELELPLFQKTAAPRSCETNIL